MGCDAAGHTLVPVARPTRSAISQHGRTALKAYHILGALIVLLGCSPATDEGVSPVIGVSGYAVIASADTSSIAILDKDGAVLDGDFIHSGSAPAGLTTALSGDVALPTVSGEPDTLVILDRHRSDVVTRVDLETGEILGQLKTHEPNDDDADQAAYSSNPHDYAYFGPDEAWVTRYGPNSNVSADAPDRGNDLLRIDPTTNTRLGRISLEMFNGTGERTNVDTGATETVTVYARPNRMVRIGDQLVVGLARLSLLYDAVDSGMVAIVDPASGETTGVELPGLQNCSHVMPVPTDAERVVVSCAGFYRGVPRETAGMALLHITADGAEIEALWTAKDDPEVPLTVQSVVPISGSLVFAAAYGSSATLDDEGNELAPATNDMGYLVDLATGTQTELFEAGGRYKIWGGSFDPDTGLLLIPDASVDENQRPTAGLRFFHRQSDGSFEAGDILQTHEILPVTMVRPL